MTPTDQIKNALFKLVRLTAAEWQVFAQNLEEVNFRKNDFLCPIGQVEQYIYFIHTGLARVYFQKESEELTLNFHFENEFVTSFSSFITQTPSRVAVQALDKVHASRIHYRAINALYNQSHNGERIGRLIAESLYLAKTNREIDLLSLSAEEQYQNLLQKNPKFISHLSVKHLASYLGIQPESLSRIRNKIGR